MNEAKKGVSNKKKSERRKKEKKINIIKRGVQLVYVIIGLGFILIPIVLFVGSINIFEISRVENDFSLLSVMLTILSLWILFISIVRVLFRRYWTKEPIVLLAILTFTVLLVLFILRQYLRYRFLSDMVLAIISMICLYVTIGIETYGIIKDIIVVGYNEEVKEYDLK